MYAVLAALAEALVAPPALLWWRSQGVFRPVLAWDVPFGAMFLCASLAVAILALSIACEAALGRRPVLPLHATLLLLVGICFVLRSASGTPRPPPDPLRSLLESLRVLASELDRSYSGTYAPDGSQLTSAVEHIDPPPFRRFGLQLSLHARVLSGADGPQLEPLAGDAPGTIYVAISADRQSAWLTALSLSTVLRLPSGHAAIAEAHSGTHSTPGRDPALPAYR
jgi:hypothetical protein